VAKSLGTLATMDIQKNDAVRAVGCSAWLDLYCSCSGGGTTGAEKRRRINQVKCRFNTYLLRTYLQGTAIIPNTTGRNR
jgi:hypothetical protein